MLWTLSVILILLWLLGLVSSYTIGGYIHILLVWRFSLSGFASFRTAARSSLKTPHAASDRAEGGRDR